MYCFSFPCLYFSLESAVTGRYSWESTEGESSGGIQWECRQTAKYCETGNCLGEWQVIGLNSHNHLRICLYIIPK